MNISSLLSAVPGALSQGVLWGVMVIGVYITFRLLDIADMTCDGSFSLGGCVCAVLIVNFNVNPVIAILASIIAGSLAGCVTGLLHTVFEIPAILAGILTQYSLWSINLRIMGGKSNVPLLKSKTIFSGLVEMTGLRNSHVALIIGVVIAIVVVMVLYWFFGTELGASLRATGNNENMIRALGVDIKKTKLLALMIANGLVAFAGALVCQSQKYADINMGTGAIVIGLASIVIGEVLFSRFKSFYMKLSSAIVGCCTYFLIRAVVLWLGLDPNDMKLLSAIIVALALATPVAMAKYRTKKAYSPNGGTEHAGN
ncbi:MAG: ABC transporter permease [Lachnospiraceae bacterium]|nr:ABC transporter permease [Lachnospiraceae bacterium]